MARVGLPLGAAEARPEVTVAEALARLQSWHAAVSKAGAGILNAYRAKGQSVPCDVRGRHNAAVSAYLRAARDVFGQLAKRGIQATQTVVDAAGKERTLGPTKENPFPAPVAPLTFVVSDCQGADRGLGAGPVALIFFGAIVTTILVVGHAAALRILWPGGPPPPLSEVADAYTKCMRETKDARGCSGLLPSKRVDWATIGIVTVLVIATAVGGILLWRKLSLVPAREYLKEQAA